MNRVLLFLFAAALFCHSTLYACPWCKRFGIKETVSAGQPDPGGKIFGKAPPADKTRHYYLAAEPVMWTWSPLGVNTSKPLPLPPYLEEQPSSSKVRYVQYTDATFTKRALDTPRLGILGPVLRGMTGEYLSVTFLNRAPWPLSIHPHGVRYDKDNEGAYTEPDPGKGSAIGPGATFTYIWQLDAMSGPQPDEPSSKAWLYHSHCKDDEEINLGLMGFIVVTDPARARPDGTPADVDREMPAMFVIFDETPEDEALEYAGTEAGKRMKPRTAAETLNLSATSMRHSINGRLFGNLEGLEMLQGERVRWYLGALGEENGLHTAHWHGARVREEGRRVVDVISLLPGETKVADQLADNPGTWLMHCHVSDHMMEGMFANYTVRPANAEAPPDAFLGSTAGASLRWTMAEINAGPDAGLSAELHGTVSSYTGFVPKNNALKLRIGSHEIALTFQDNSTATAAGTRLEVTSLGATGVVTDEVMPFKLTLEGTAWRKALGSAGLKKERTTLQIELELGDVRHSAQLMLKSTVQGKWVLTSGR